MLDKQHLGFEDKAVYKGDDARFLASDGWRRSSSQCECGAKDSRYCRGIPGTFYEDVVCGSCGSVIVALAVRGGMLLG